MKEEEYEKYIKLIESLKEDNIDEKIEEKYNEYLSQTKKENDTSDK